MIARCTRSHKQGGSSLAVVMAVLLLAAVTVISGLQSQLQAQHMAAREWDHLRTFEAAQALLLDAEQDIQSPSPHASESPAWPQSFDDWLVWQTRLAAPHSPCQQGVCAAQASQHWTRAHWRTLQPASKLWDSGARYGQRTGARDESGQALLQQARYWIEMWPLNTQQTSTEPTPFIYRITAVAWGQRAGTHVVLQSLWRQPGGRLAWRELWP